ncbi:MAG: extracellular solute-binding protein [Clostridia bacterium]|nr:extracellular solute-binding protein [Clostridia bacterium]
MRKTIKRTITTLFAVVASGTALTACAPKTDGDEIRLTVWVAEGDTSFMRWAQDEFRKANPDKNYRFVVDYQGENDIATRILNDVENAADVFSFPNDQIAKLVNGDALSRLGGDVLSDLTSSIDAGAMESATVKVGEQNETYGMPYTDNTFFMYYDKSVLTADDVKSLDGILAKCSKNKQFAMPLTDGWYSTSFYFGKNLGYEVTYDKDLAETSIRCDFDNEVGKQVTNAIWSLVQDSRVKADANDSKITAGFNDGSIVAGVTGIWNRTAIESYLGDNFAVAKLPTYTLNKGTANEEQVQLVSFAGYKLLGVNNYSKQKAEAIKFARFYTNKQSQLKHFELRGFVPTDTEARKDERVQTDACAAAITAQLAHSKAQKNVPSTLWVPMEGLGNAMLTGLTSGTFNLEEQLKACVDAIEK